MATVFGVCDSEVIECGFESVLRRKACVSEIPLLVIPFNKPAIVKGLHVVGDDKRYHVVHEAFFEHHEPAYTAVAVLEGMDALEAHMKADDVFEGVSRARVIRFQERLHLFGDVFRKSGLPAADLVR